MDLLLEQILPLVSSVCARLAGSARDDAVQDTLLAVFRRLSTLERPETLIAWVATIARREAVRHARQHSGEPLPSDHPAIERADTLELHEAFDALSPQQREVLILRDLVGLSECEIAELLTLARGTVKSRLHRARAAFREVWVA